MGSRTGHDKGHGRVNGTGTTLRGRPSARSVTSTCLGYTKSVIVVFLHSDVKDEQFVSSN